MNNSWARADDEAVALHYLRHGEAEHDEIIAALPHHRPASIRMRPDNLKAPDTAVAHGLPNAAQQQRDIWAFASAVRDALRRLLSTLRRHETGVAGNPWGRLFVHRYAVTDGPESASQAVQ